MRQMFPSVSLSTCSPASLHSQGAWEPRRESEKRKEGEKELYARLLGPLSPEDPQLLPLLRERYLTPPSTKLYNLSTDPLYHRLRNHDGWVFMFPHIKKLLGDQREGFFVEAGALDGEWLSNTLWLEQELGWTGLLIEPNPDHYRNLLAKHRKAWTSQTCLSSQPYPKEEVFVSISKKSSPGPAATLHAYDSYGSSHVLGVSIGSRLYDDQLAASEKSYSLVQCFPLVTYLLALNISTVDLLSLDVQGMEKDVLSNVPWSRVAVRVLMVEVVHQETIDEPFVEYMRSQNFTLIYFRVEDYIFVRNGDPLLEKLDTAVLYT